jgi:hypothetical protein
MRRLVCIAVVALIVSGMAVAAQAGSSISRPPTTASLMPAYVQAAKYWQARGLAMSRRSAGKTAHRGRTHG